MCVAGALEGRPAGRASLKHRALVSREMGAGLELDVQQNLTLTRGMRFWLIFRLPMFGNELSISCVKYNFGMIIFYILNVSGF